ncbi:hypothetical protein DFJ73DRAFT_203104 [Zopfochytrium polystomum]|nr:hypothetical protein DFJ73DRAFT_203104 [Zopfochytrium polystomum]
MTGSSSSSSSTSTPLSGGHGNSGKRGSNAGSHAKRSPFARPSVVGSVRHLEAGSTGPQDVVDGKAAATAASGTPTSVFRFRQHSAGHERRSFPLSWQHGRRSQEEGQASVVPSSDQIGDEVVARPSSGSIASSNRILRRSSTASLPSQVTLSRPAFRILPVRRRHSSELRQDTGSDFTADSTSIASSTLSRYFDSSNSANGVPAPYLYYANAGRSVSEAATRDAELTSAPTVPLPPSRDALDSDTRSLNSFAPFDAVLLQQGVADVPSSAPMPMGLPRRPPSSLSLGGNSGTPTQRNSFLLGAKKKSSDVSLKEPSSSWWKRGSSRQSMPATLESPASSPSLAPATVAYTPSAAVGKKKSWRWSGMSASRGENRETASHESSSVSPKSSPIMGTTPPTASHARSTWNTSASTLITPEESPLSFLLGGTTAPSHDWVDDSESETEGSSRFATTTEVLPSDSETSNSSTRTSRDTKSDAGVSSVSGFGQAEAMVAAARFNVRSMSPHRPPLPIEVGAAPLEPFSIDPAELVDKDDEETSVAVDPVISVYRGAPRPGAVVRPSKLAQSIASRFSSTNSSSSESEDELGSLSFGADGGEDLILNSRSFSTDDEFDAEEEERARQKLVASMAAAGSRSLRSSSSLSSLAASRDPLNSGNGTNSTSLPSSSNQYVQGPRRRRSGSLPALSFLPFAATVYNGDGDITPTRTPTPTPDSNEARTTLTTFLRDATLLLPLTPPTESSSRSPSPAPRRSTTPVPHNNPVSLAFFKHGVHISAEECELRGGKPLVSGLPSWVGSWLTAEFTLYTVTVKLLKPKVTGFRNATPSTFAVTRRYREFESMYKAMLKEYGDFVTGWPPFPSKGYFDRFSPSTIAHRVRCFNNILNFITLHPQLHGSLPLLKFLGVRLRPTSTPIQSSSALEAISGANQLRFVSSSSNQPIGNHSDGEGVQLPSVQFHQLAQAQASEVRSSYLRAALQLDNAAGPLSVNDRRRSITPSPTPPSAEGGLVLYERTLSSASARRAGARDEVRAARAPTPVPAAAVVVEERYRMPLRRTSTKRSLSVY